MLRSARRRPQLSQNFLHSRKLVKNLIGRSSIDKSNLVLEIGPGKGIITQGLIKASRQVIAVELDTSLHHYLKKKFKLIPNLSLINQDFLDFNLPQEPYKVFANLPFAIEGKAIRKLINAQNPPEDCYLVVRRDLAKRLAGVSYNSQFSISYKPWFKFELFHAFYRSDFSPQPKVQATMLRFTKRKNPLLPLECKKSYQKFIINSFKNTLNPTKLSFHQWLKTFKNLQGPTLKGLTVR